MSVFNRSSSGDFGRRGTNNSIMSDEDQMINIHTAAGMLLRSPFGVTTKNSSKGGSANASLTNHPLLPSALSSHYAGFAPPLEGGDSSMNTSPQAHSLHTGTFGGSRGNFTSANPSPQTHSLQTGTFGGNRGNFPSMNPSPNVGRLYPRTSFAERRSNYNSMNPSPHSQTLTAPSFTERRSDGNSQAQTPLVPSTNNPSPHPDSLPPVHHHHHHHHHHHQLHPHSPFGIVGGASASGSQSPMHANQMARASSHRRHPQDTSHHDERGGGGGGAGMDRGARREFERMDRAPSNYRPSENFSPRAWRMPGVPSHADLARDGQTIMHDDKQGRVGSHTGKVCAILTSVVTPAGVICEGEIVESINGGESYVVKCPFPDAVLQPMSAKASARYRRGAPRFSVPPRKQREEDNERRKKQFQEMSMIHSSNNNKTNNDGENSGSSSLVDTISMPFTPMMLKASTDGNNNNNNNNNNDKEDDTKRYPPDDEFGNDNVPPELRCYLESVIRSVTPDGLTEAEVAHATEVEVNTARRYFTAEFPRRDVLPYGFQAPSTIFNRVGRHTNLGLVVGWDPTFFTYQVEQRSLTGTKTAYETTSGKADVYDIKIVSATLAELQLPPALTRGEPVGSFRVGATVVCRRFGAHDLDEGKVIAVAPDVTYTVRFRFDDVVQCGILHSDMKQVSQSLTDRVGVQDRVLVGLMGAKRATVIQCYPDSRFRVVTDDGEQLLLGDSNLLSVRPPNLAAVGCSAQLAALFDMLDDGLVGKCSWLKFRKAIVEDHGRQWVKTVLAPLNTTLSDTTEESAAANPAYSTFRRVSTMILQHQTSRRGSEMLLRHGSMGMVGGSTLHGIAQSRARLRFGSIASFGSSMSDEADLSGVLPHPQQLLIKQQLATLAMMANSSTNRDNISWGDNTNNTNKHNHLGGSTNERKLMNRSITSGGGGSGDDLDWTSGASRAGAGNQHDAQSVPTLVSPALSGVRTDDSELSDPVVSFLTINPTMLRHPYGDTTLPPALQAKRQNVHWGGEQQDDEDAVSAEDLFRDLFRGGGGSNVAYHHQQQQQHPRAGTSHSHTQHQHHRFSPRASIVSLTGGGMSSQPNLVSMITTNRERDMESSRFVKRVQRVECLHDEVGVALEKAFEEWQAVRGLPPNAMHAGHDADLKFSDVAFLYDHIVRRLQD